MDYRECITVSEACAHAAAKVKQATFFSAKVYLRFGDDSVCFLSCWVVSALCSTSLFPQMPKNKGAPPNCPSMFYFPIVCLHRSDFVL